MPAIVINAKLTGRELFGPLRGFVFFILYMS